MTCTCSRHSQSHAIHHYSLWAVSW